ncbi:thermonuclease family protein [Methylobacter luteus]|uniref:thermonuclease family protein n=1 Tax=Methylobacter luteus TaxID=415 RepID=UPI00040E9E33|nr:thermonuclease family protein [Methylobacter luteus]
MKIKVKKLVLALALLAPFSAFSTEWTGTVVGILDGDTLTVLNADKRQVKIRMAGIDAPESKQAFGTQSKKSLSNICFKKSVIIDDHGTDRYKRTLGRITCDGIDANAEQVKRGMAWAYKQYLTDQTIAGLEETAKASKTGLWVDENPIPPWEFRHGSKTAKAAKKLPVKKVSASSAGFECGSKSRCGDMSSCAEATFYLNECGKSRLDRDNDGVPCESLCK